MRVEQFSSSPLSLQQIDSCSNTHRHCYQQDGSYNHVEAEGDTYEEARENLYALLEEGQNLIAIRKGL